MLFTSYGFLAFLCVLFLLYYCLPRRWQWGVLLAASAFFYAFAGWDCLLLLTASAFCAYLIARLMAGNARREGEFLAARREEMTKEERKAYKAKQKKNRFRILCVGLLIGFGILAVLKYASFAVWNLNSLLTRFGADGVTVPNLLLPMGISFYTFQTMGYLIDVYRGKTQAQTNFAKFALFVGFFPQLVQGPISRHSELAAQLYEPHAWNGRAVTYGVQRILWGYFKKLVIADRVFIAVKTLIQFPEDYRGGYVVLLILLYSVQIYTDFTGGMDIAIGIAQALGLRLAENFDRPFSSRSTKEYWRRWHITMGTWFTDYVFYPVSVCRPMLNFSKWARTHLGNGMGKRIPVYLATAVTWFLTGLWHGAGWNFIVWGMLNCLVILVSQECEPLYARFRGRFPRLVASRGYGAWEAIRTFLLMGLIRSLDCYRDVGLTFRQWGSMLTTWNWGTVLSSWRLLGLSAADWLILGAGVLAVAVVSRIGIRKSVRDRLYDRPVCSAVLCGLLVFAVVLFGAYGVGYDASQFIYNQF